MCEKCGHLACVCACVCDFRKNHVPKCRFRIAATCPIPIPCECEGHYDVCPKCDPCTCPKEKDPEVLKSMAQQLSDTAQDLFEEAKVLEMKDLKDERYGPCSPQWYLHFDWEYRPGRGYDDFVFFLYPKNKDIWDILNKYPVDDEASVKIFKRLKESGFISRYVAEEYLVLGLNSKSSVEQWTKLQKILTSISIKNSEEFKQDVVKERNECHLNSTRLNELSFGLAAKHLNLN